MWTQHKEVFVICLFVFKVTAWKQKARSFKVEYSTICNPHTAHGWSSCPAVQLLWLGLNFPFVSKQSTLHARNGPSWYVRRQMVNSRARRKSKIWFSDLGGCSNFSVHELLRLHVEPTWLDAQKNICFLNFVFYFYCNSFTVRIFFPCLFPMTLEGAEPGLPRFLECRARFLLRVEPWLSA